MCKKLFFFQAEDGIRDLYVTGVQTCALPISRMSSLWPLPSTPAIPTISPRWTSKETLSTMERPPPTPATDKIGRASCRERVEISVGRASLEKKIRPATPTPYTPTDERLRAAR